MRRLLEIALLAVLAYLLLSRCNTPMAGKAAPALQGEDWLLRAGVEQPADPNAGWRLLAFFSPT